VIYDVPLMHRAWYIVIFLLLTLGLGLGMPVSAMGQVRTLKAISYAGKRYVALKDLAKMYGLPLKVQGKKILLIRGQYTSLQFKTNGREATLNGCKIWLHAPVTKVRGKWSVSDADAKFIVDPIVRPSAYLGARQARTVVLDPGHGGKDPGTIGKSGIMEKVLVLDISRRVRAHLAAAGVRVVMTRDRDRFWGLKDRPYLATRGKGDLFVSIHVNSAGSRSAQGVETYVMPAENYPPTSDARLNRKYPVKPNNRFNHSNTVLGSQIHRGVVGITRASDRGLKHARFAVLKNTAMPAVLIECGFVSNPQEEKRLNTPSYRETLAQGIAQGILNYLAIVKRAKMDMGAPLIQKPTQVASSVTPAAARAAPIPMAARAWGPAPKPVSAPAPAPAAPKPVRPPVTTAPVASVRAAAPSPARQTPSAPTARTRPAKAVAPPPSMLLNSTLSSHTSR
jgi:N-acetylmuramoyl-L-alanine amidase